MGNQLVTIEAIGQRTIVGSIIFRATPEYAYPVAMVPEETAKGLIGSGNFRIAEPFVAPSITQEILEADAPGIPVAQKPEKPKAKKTRTRKVKK